MSICHLRRPDAAWLPVDGHVGALTKGRSAGEGHLEVGGHMIGFLKPMPAGLRLPPVAT